MARCKPAAPSGRRRPFPKALAAWGARASGLAAWGHAAYNNSVSDNQSDGTLRCRPAALSGRPRTFPKALAA
jgi:hypothetical protein